MARLDVQKGDGEPRYFEVEVQKGDVQSRYFEVGLQKRRPL